jgi:site-specific recombinase XerD
VAEHRPSADAAGALERFLSHLEARNASPGTLVEYRRHVTEFLGFLADRRADWRGPDRATVRAYLASLADRHLAASTVGGRLAAMPLGRAGSRPTRWPASAPLGARGGCHAC